MNAIAEYQSVSPTTLADILGREQVVEGGIRPLWSPMPRVAGPAFTVRCPPGDNLMLHAAIHRAERGSVIVVQAGDVDYAVSGGNVCAVAQRRGITAFVVDGMIPRHREVQTWASSPCRGPVPFLAQDLVRQATSRSISSCHQSHASQHSRRRRRIIPYQSLAESSLSERGGGGSAGGQQSLKESETEHRSRIDSILARHRFTD